MATSFLMRLVFPEGEMESYDLLSQDQTACKLIYQRYKSAKDDIDANPPGTMFDGALISRRLQSATHLLMITAEVGDCCGTAWVLDDLHDSFLLGLYFKAKVLGPVMAAIENGHIDTVKLFLLLTSWSVTDEMLTRARTFGRQQMINFLVGWKQQPRVLENADKDRVRVGWKIWRDGPDMRFEDVWAEMEDAA
ncbi:hypothetical protein E5D57_011322 [Metarhizium anisopliae]|nr:hypothetical protein E5D57_011322 [Metarhizium anisopliae]